MKRIAFALLVLSLFPIAASAAPVEVPSLSVTSISELPGEMQATPIFILPTSSLNFTASPDHNATSALSGVAIVTKYLANYCQVLTPTNCVAVDLGKGTPDATNTIKIPNFFGQLTPNILWTVSVKAQGPGGDSTATAGNAPFGLDAPPAPKPVPAVTVIR